MSKKNKDDEYVPKLIKLKIDVVPFKENEYAHDTLNGYDNYHIDYEIIERDFIFYKEEIIDDICHKILKSYQMPDVVKNADTVLLIERDTRRVLRIINNNFIKKDELKCLKNINDIAQLQYILREMLGEKYE